MYPKEISACFECFCKVYLILILGVALFYFDARYDFRAEVMQNGTCPNLLNNVFIFFRVKCPEA